MPLPPPYFDGSDIWDGTTPRTRPNTDVFKRADGEVGNRHSSEIIALEEKVIDVLTAIDILLNLGAANSILGVKDDQSGLEYKTLVEGTGVTITHGTGTITIASSGGTSTAFSCNAGESLSLGDVVYIETDGKAYKAQADSANTSDAVGLSDRNASANDAILVIANGDVANGGWSLTAGDRYYLDTSVAGGITSTPPPGATPGTYVVPIGVATSTTKLAVDLKLRIQT